MPLESRDLKVLTLVLDSGYAQIAFFEEVVVYAGRDPQNIASADTKRLRILNILRAADREGWLSALLTEICDDDRFAEGHEVKRQAARIKAALAARAAELAAIGGSNPLDALVVYQRPFINRESFRADLQRFAGGNPSVYVVRGLPASGKSYSWFMIRHYCEATNGARLAMVDLSNRDPSATEPRDLMETLAQKMHIDRSGMSRDTLAQDARISAKLTEWLVGQSRQFNSNWWIGFDGLDRPQASQGALDLVSRLAAAVEQGELEKTWLVLLGLERPLPTEIDRFVYRDRLMGIDRSDVKLYLGKVAEAREAVIENDALDLMADHVLAGMAIPLQHENMDEFSRRLTDVVATILPKSDGGG